MSGEGMDDAMMLMDVVETLRREEADLKEVLDKPTQDAQTIARVAALYASQGMPVDKALIEAGMRGLREKQFEFVAPRRTLFTQLAEAYVRRKVWGPVLMVRGGITLAVALTGMMLLVSIQALRYSSWSNAADATVATETTLRQSYQALGANLNSLPEAPRAVALAGVDARRQWQDAGQSLAALPSLPADKDALEDVYDNSRTQAWAMVQARQAALVRAEELVKKGQAAISNVRGLAEAFKDQAIFDQPVPAHLTNLRTLQKAAFLKAAEDANAQGMRAAVDTLRAGLRLDGQREALVAQASTLPTAAQAVVLPKLSESLSALSVGNTVAATALLAGVQSQVDGIARSYELRVVNEPNEKTAVWRYYEDNKSGRSYYVIVDAVDATGKSVSLPVRSVEDGKTTTTSRFGVRITEAAFEDLKRDKLDNGIIDDNPVVGKKAAGEVDATYAIDFQDGFITSW